MYFSRLIRPLMIKFVFLVILFLFSQTVYGAAIIIDHDCIDLGQIPDAWLNDAKNNLHIVYQHTSHGSQLVTGMSALENYPEFGTKYEWTDNGSGGLDFDDYGIPGCADLSQGDWIDTNGVTPWVTATRNLLDNAVNNHVNVVMWSWCSINGHNILRYIDNMEILVSEYGQGGSKPRAADHPVKFIFMTGHAEGQGETGFIYSANQQIRQHCIDNDRILFDFADIESYDPDGNYYYDRPMWDDLDYNPGHINNWGIEWCIANSDTEIEKLATGTSGYSGCGNCAHSGDAGDGETVNCVLKGRAVWWMFARLAGWTGPGGDIIPPSRTNGQPNGELPAGTIQTNISLTTNENATCRWSTTAGTAYDSMIGTFSTTGNTSHSTTVDGLSDGNSYAYCVRCRDTSGNSNMDDFEISFNVQSPGVDDPVGDGGDDSSGGGCFIQTAVERFGGKNAEN